MYITYTSNIKSYNDCHLCHAVVLTRLTNKGENDIKMLKIFAYIENYSNTYMT